MKLRAELAAVLLALAGPPAAAQSGGAMAPNEPQGGGPRGSSQPAPGERRVDLVSAAGVVEMSGAQVVAPGLSPGDFAEVTALDTGRTIVVAAGAGDAQPGRLVTLSPDAATALSLEGEGDGVRVRRVQPTPEEIAGLRRGGEPPRRDDAPPTLLAALRRKMAAVAVPNAPSPSLATRPMRSAARPSPEPVKRPPLARPAPAAPHAPAAGSYVQIAALSDAVRAAALARQVGGVVERHGALYRVHLGPFAGAAALARGRARAAALGYRSTQIVRITP